MGINSGFYSPINLKKPFTFVEKTRPAFYFEEWRPVVYDQVEPGYYFVSNFGRLKNINGEILSCYKINSGYYVFKLFKDKEHRHLTNNRYKEVTVHRLVLSTFYPVFNMDKLTINHKDGDKSNNVLWNLEWQTQLMNNIHSYNNGLNKNYGENSKISKFTEAQVIQICEILQSGNYKNYREILNIIGMEGNPNNQDMIGNIKRRIAWKWISCNYTW